MALNTMSSPQASLRQLVDRCLLVHDNFARIKFSLSIGLMSGSAAASPILFEYRKTWLVDILIFFISAAMFMVLYHEQMKKYGPWMLAVITVLGILAYSSARTSLGELVPWIAIALCLSLLLTAYFLPKLGRVSSGPDNAEIRGERGRSYHLQSFTAEPGSIQISEHTQNQDHDSFAPCLREHEVSNMDGSGMNIPGTSSVRSSDIDLEDQMDSAHIALNRVVGLFNGPCHTSSPIGYPLSNGPPLPVETFNRDRGELPPTKSPDSLVVTYHQSVSADSESPMLDG